jgi:hypothetical protein
MKGARKIMNDEIVICANLQIDNPIYLCVTPDGKFFTCTIGKNGDQFLLENISFICKEESMKFVAQITQESMSFIQGIVEK